jgi:acyl carrier protein phosphodiesterase
MNHLAHFYLSFDEPDLAIGNWVADFIQHPQVVDFSAEIQRGIHLHRFIDSFSDEHPQIGLGATRLRPFVGKYARVFMDIFNDHLLSISWKTWSPDISLADFSKKTYNILENKMAVLPPDLQTLTQKLIKNNWLEGYGTEEGIAFVVEKFEHRMRENAYFQSAKPDLKGALNCFLTEKPLFLEEFLIFFNEMKRAAQQLLQNQKNQTYEH